MQNNCKGTKTTTKTRKKIQRQPKKYKDTQKQLQRHQINKKECQNKKKDMQNDDRETTPTRTSCKITRKTHTTAAEGLKQLKRRVKRQQRD